MILFVFEGKEREVDIFDAQCKKYVETDECGVAVLNSFPLFVYDYFK